MNRRLIVMAAAVTILLAVAVIPKTMVNGAPAVPPVHLGGGAASPDALIGDLLTALAAGDEKALHRLRVTEDEYRGIIIPGSTSPGNPPRAVSEEVSAYFWLLLDTKSRDYGRSLLDEFGGQDMTPKKISYSEGSRRYAWYTAHGQVRLEVERQPGGYGLVRTGWIAELNGRYKFIGFDWDD